MHFPVAALTAAWVCAVFRHATGAPGWARVGRALEWFGVVTLPLAIVSAFVDTRGFDFLVHPRWDQPLVWHALLGTMATVVFALHALWARRLGDERLGLGSAVADLALVTLAFALVVVTGHLGGEMVFSA